MNIIIIGNGIAGTSAALSIRQHSDFEITMISNESEFPYSRTALMYIYMGHLPYNQTKLYEDRIWKKQKINLIPSNVLAIDPIKKTVTLDEGKTILFDKLIIATGSVPMSFNWPGVYLQGVQSLYNLQDLSRMHKNTQKIKRGVVVGGGLIGIEMAEMLHSRKIPVTYLVREDDFWNHVLADQESDMINKEIVDHHIDLRLSTQLQEIVDDGNGNVKGIVTDKKEFIACEFVGITIGVKPNIDLAKTVSGLEINKGILVNNLLETSLKDIYAIGDCAEISVPEKNRKPVEPMWYTAKLMGTVAGQNICNIRTRYNPGIWYNSAKFFNIEYQVYGDIPANPVEGYTTLFWRHHDRKHSIRINYETVTKAVTGFNLLGIRYRQEVCLKWIKEKATIEYVLKNLSLANFDPEFYTEYEQELIDQYNTHENKQIRLESKRKLSLVENFLTS